MFEDFRKQMDDSLFTDDSQPEKPLAQSSLEAGHFLGMTPVQRFTVAILLLLMTIVLGILALLVTTRVVLPILG